MSASIWAYHIISSETRRAFPRRFSRVLGIRGSILNTQYPFDTKEPIYHDGVRAIPATGPEPAWACARASSGWISKFRPASRRRCFHHVACATALTFAAPGTYPGLAHITSRPAASCAGPRSCYSPADELPARVRRPTSRYALWHARNEAGSRDGSNSCSFRTSLSIWHDRLFWLTPNLTADGGRAGEEGDETGSPITNTDE